MRYRVRHVSRYGYGSPVDLAAHTVHLRPRPLPFQRVISERLDTTPNAARRRDGHDHFGNRVTWLFLDLPHADFEVVAESIVDVQFPPSPSPATSPPWESVVAAARTPAGWRAAEFRFESVMAANNADARAYAAQSFPPNRPVLEGLIELNGRIRKDFRFRAGVTTIATPVSQLMQRREGVCQDFAHVMISALRGLGLPTRYVSGYIRTKPPPGQKRRPGSDVSHAWVGCWLGPSLGWIDLDPTNDLVVADEHVVLGWGRDYADVSPVHGIIFGGSDNRLEVAVDLVPEEDLAA